MFKLKDKIIKNNTKRIAKGTYALATMPDDQIEVIFKRMEKSKLQKAAKYKLPEWFSIEFIPKEDDICEFVGSFSDGDGYPLVYKNDFLELLTKYKVNYEELKNNTYKIHRTPEE